MNLAPDLIDAYAPLFEIDSIERDHIPGDYVVGTRLLTPAITVDLHLASNPYHAVEPESWQLFVCAQGDMGDSTQSLDFMVENMHKLQSFLEQTGLHFEPTTFQKGYPDSSLIVPEYVLESTDGCEITYKDVGEVTKYLQNLNLFTVD